MSRDAISRGLRNRLLAALAAADVLGPPSGEGSPEQLISLAREIQVFRKRRSRWLPPHTLGEPAWDILLALFVAAGEGRTLAIGQVGQETGTAQTTVFRTLAILHRAGLITRTRDAAWRTRVLLGLSEQGEKAMRGALSSWPCAPGG